MKARLVREYFRRFRAHRVEVASVLVTLPSRQGSQ
jgi:hypothetical protein